MSKRRVRADRPLDPAPAPDLLNLGPVSRRWLAGVGVRSQRDLERLGAAAAYVRVRDAGFAPSLNLLWALQGAIDGVHWTMVPPRVRDQLKQQVGR